MLVERFVCRQLVAFLETEWFFSAYQFAYWKHDTTETAVLKVVSDALLASDRGDGTLLGLLNLSTALTLSITTLSSIVSIQHSTYRQDAVHQTVGYQDALPDHYNELNFYPHIIGVWSSTKNESLPLTNRRCFYHLRQLRSIRWSLNADATTIPVSTIIISRVEYCNSVFYGTGAVCLRPIQSIVNCFTLSSEEVEERPHHDNSSR